MDERRTPVWLEAEPTGELSRWLWLVKWVLLIPHYFILAFLWLAYVVLTFAAWWAILFTGQYPRGIFDFNVGVMRWNWRVQYYGYSALATDQYPPFTLQDVASYPARLLVDYPPRLSRLLIFVKWLLAIPHLIIVSILVGGSRSLVQRMADTSREIEYNSPGVIGLLALVVGLLLLFSGNYPRGLWRVLMGLNRWVVRANAYVALMTDEYPPFRLDMDEREPAAVCSQGSSAVSSGRPGSPYPQDQHRGPAYPAPYPQNSQNPPYPPPIRPYDDRPRP